MTHDTNIPQGYKATALGIIPQEWKTIRLKDCFSISAGGDVLKDCFSETRSLQYKYPIYSNSLFNHGLYGFTSHPRHKANSITITGRGALGHAEYRETDFDAIVRLLVLAPKIPLNGQYITEYINFREPFFYESTGVPQLTAPQIANIQVLFPPLAEQRKIAEVLGVWDEAIEKQARLIEKLALRKRALMQRLLSAKLRLPGFSEPWKKVKFCELFTKSIKTADPLKKYEVLSVTKEGIVAQKSYFNKDIASEDTSKYIVVERGDLAMSGLNFWMGSCHILTNFDEGIISPAYKVFKVTEHNNIDFIRDFVRSSMFLQALQGCSVIGASIVRRNLDKEMLYEWTFKIPSLKEQTAIAEVLTAADREIELAKEKLERLRRQKRGLMQQLLTGKKRTKI